MAVFFTLLGLILVMVGGAFLVPAAEELARNWGVSEAVIGVTVIALGTSLPELATTVAGLRRGRPGWYWAISLAPTFLIF